MEQEKMTKKGWIVAPDEKGNLCWHEQTFPIETNSSLVAWMQDFWQAYLERPKILRWIARKAMGKYAYRELYGSKDTLIKTKQYFEGFGYSLESMEYHKDKIPT